MVKQQKTPEALQIAMQMELDGKQFYLKCSQESSNELGKNLLQWLAQEEDLHRKKFVEIYDVVKNKGPWPAIDFKPDGGRSLRTIFARTSEKLGCDIQAPITELDAIQRAIDMEGKTYDFYRKQSKLANYDAERTFYDLLAGEEQEHHLILLDYHEYLKDPAGWFVKKEHPSLDGG
ncbi:MAG: ferritin family protein [Chloroflexi bacterium]|nr:ferritin family protein [Chloroflexota bacterium]